MRLSLGGAWPELGKKESILGGGDLEMLWGERRESHIQGTDKESQASLFFFP